MTTSKMLLLAVLAWMVALPASAHGLLARVRVEGNLIVGTVYYSSGEPAGGEWVQVFNRSLGGAKVSEFSAGADGAFRFEGVAGNDYLITVHGDEGHSIELSMSIAQGARAKLVDAPAEAGASGLTDLPAWAVIGALLALLSALALFHRARSRGPVRA
jgi:hypothetical protein